MQTILLWIVLGGLLLAALFGGDGLHAQSPTVVYLPMIEYPVKFSSTPPVIIPTATPERGPDGRE